MTNETSSNEDIVRALRSLESRLETVARPYEDALSERLFSNARERLINYAKVSFAIVGVVVAGFAALGWTNYRQTLKDVETTVRDQLEKKVGKFLDGDDGKKLVETVTEKTVQPAISKARKEYDLEMQKDRERFAEWIASVRKAYEDEVKIIQASRVEVQQELRERIEAVSNETQALRTAVEKATTDFNERLQKLATNTNTTLPQPVAVMKEVTRKLESDAYCYFGVKSRDEKWVETYFVNLNGAPISKPPKPADKFKSTVRVFVRGGWVNYGGNSAQLAPAVGVLDKDATVTIANVRMTDRGSEGFRCWVQISTNSELLPL